MTALLSRLDGLEPQSICIIKPSSLGDIVHSLPILTALRSRWPSAHIVWVARRPFDEVLEGHLHLNELIVYDRRRNRVDFSALGRTARLYQTLVRGRFDLTIDLQGLLRSGLMTAATLARMRIGLADAREGATRFYTHVIDAPRRVHHAVERTLMVAEALGAVVSEPQFHLPINKEHRQWARLMLRGLSSPRIVLNVGGRWVTKRWPGKHFAEIASRAVAEFGAQLIAVGSVEDRPLVDELARHLRPGSLLDLCGCTRLMELAALTVEADLMISNDTGPLHLAAAAGARVLGIYTCTSPKLTGPFGIHASTVESSVWCSPSFRKKCNRLDCMFELTPDRVWPAVKSQLDQVIARS
jgi:heptosyltransferase-1